MHSQIANQVYCISIRRETIQDLIATIVNLIDQTDHLYLWKEESVSLAQEEIST